MAFALPIQMPQMRSRRTRTFRAIIRSQIRSTAQHTEATAGKEITTVAAAAAVVMIGAEKKASGSMRLTIIRPVSVDV
jgi:hypothetical protein